jgi:hypothetical protein
LILQFTLAIELILPLLALATSLGRWIAGSRNFPLVASQRVGRLLLIILAVCVPYFRPFGVGPSVAVGQSLDHIAGIEQQIRAVEQHLVVLRENDLSRR